MDTSSLMEQILSKDNLNQAYMQVVRNKGAEGVDEMKYTELKEHLEKNGENIKEQLRTRKYKPQPVRRVEIPKPDGGVRNLGVPTVTDRFVQQAIAQILTPIYEEQFHDHSYGFRPNRCAQQAIITALDMMNDGYNWIVDIDLEKFFDTVNHDKLMTLIGKTIKDGDVISIIRKFLVSGIMVDDEYKESVIGTPQGGNLSPLLANIMLNELDKEMEQRGLNFVRYADDCIIMVGSEMSAKRVMRNLTKFIEEKLGLRVNMTKSTNEMMQVKEFYGKLGGRVATHGIISLDREESDPKNAGKLMLLLNDFMAELFPEHQVVYAVHTNTENLHILRTKLFNIAEANKMLCQIDVLHKEMFRHLKDMDEDWLEKNIDVLIKKYNKFKVNFEMESNKNIPK